LLTPRPRRLPSVAAGAALCASLLAGCATQSYTPQPIDLAVEPARRLALRADDAELRAALGQQGIDVSTWPLPVWDEPALLALAYARQPELAVARAELRAAQATATAQRTTAKVSGAESTLEHRHGDDSPWTLGLVIDLPFTGSARRAAQAEAADALADEAVQRAAQAAWSARQQVRASLREQALAIEQREAGDAVLAQQRAVVAALRSRLALGAIDARELAQATQAEAEAQRQALRAQEAAASAQAALAAALGLAPEALQAMKLAAPVDREAIDSTPLELQRAALVNRLDLRAALARHAQAEAALKLEVARQWPELVFKPGIAWDQGQNVWSFGLALNLPPGGDNRAAIERARAERELSAERVRALQAQALVRLDAARAALVAADLQLASARQAWQQSQSALAGVERSVGAGSADRVELANARRAEAGSRGLHVEARAARAAARAALEDALQRPLDITAPGIAILAGSRP